VVLAVLAIWVVLAISARTFRLARPIGDRPLLKGILHAVSPEGKSDRDLLVFGEVLGRLRPLGLAEGLCRLPDLLHQRASISKRRLQAPQALFISIELRFLNLSEPTDLLDKTPQVA